MTPTKTLEEQIRVAIELKKQKDGWEKERKDTIRYLRARCKDWGDNDWPRDLHLVDILDKHLFDHLHYKYVSLKDIERQFKKQREEIIKKIKTLDFSDIPPKEVKKT